MRKSHITRCRRDDRGVVALEFVLVAPFLMALILVIGSFGAFFSKKVEVTGAARNAARDLALRDSTPDYQGFTPSNIITCAPGDTTNNASVTLTTTYTFEIPLPILSNLPILNATKQITAEGTMRCGG